MFAAPEACVERRFEACEGVQVGPGPALEDVVDGLGAEAAALGGAVHGHVLESVLEALGDALG